MPALSQRQQQARSEELNEFPFAGPFAGIMSEMSIGRIEKYGGLFDILNMVLRDGRAIVRPGWTTLPAMPGTQEAWVGFADFFDSQANHHQVGFTPSRMFEWDGTLQQWTQIAGTLHGTATVPVNWTVVGYQLLFSQGVDKVQRWDGTAGSFAQVSPNAVPAKYLMELETYLIVANTNEGGTPAPQRIRWTSPADPTDWTSLSAGQVELLNAQGPINGLFKLYQNGYAIQQKGITQIIPTGNGLAPFAFIPIASNNHGTPYPGSVAFQGGEIACFAGPDNVYSFDGSSVNPIGNMVIQGTREKLGARRRIMADLRTVDPFSVRGHISTNVDAIAFYAYWLVIPNVATWVYNFDEQNWTRFSYDKLISSIGNFDKAGVIRIMDLSGPIASQNWTPATLAGQNPVWGMALGFSDGTCGYIDFNNYSELPWSISSGQHTCQDLRHQKNVKKFRVSVVDMGQITFTMSVTGILYPVVNPAIDGSGGAISTNNTKVTDTKIISMGSGTGQEVTRVVEFNVPGQYVMWKISGDPRIPAGFVEVTPIYDIGGEQRGA